MSWRGAALVCLLALTGPETRAQSSGDVTASAPYLEIVELYAAGEHAEALAAIGAWSERDVRREVDNLWAALAAAKVPAQRSRVLRLLRAAALLHAERDWQERWSLPTGDPDPARCLRGGHGDVAEQLFGFLLRQPAEGDFVRRLARAATVYEHETGCLVLARHWAEAGRKAFPRYPQILLALGALEEATASLRTLLLTEHDQVTARQREQTRAARAERAASLDRARGLFEQALLGDADLQEARLRLGRVLWSLERREAAQEALTTVVTRSTSPSLLYLAHLFLGRIHEDADRMAEAESEYRAALACDPSAQAAAIGLAHVLQRGGDEAGARDILDRALAHAGRRRGGDVYWSYMTGRPERGEALLDELRAEAR